MANLSITVPDASIDELLIVADEYLRAEGLDPSGMTQAQRGRGLIRILLRNLYIARVTDRRSAATRDAVAAEAAQIV